MHCMTVYHHSETFVFTPNAAVKLAPLFAVSVKHVHMSDKRVRSASLSHRGHVGVLDRIGVDHNHRTFVVNVSHSNADRYLAR